MDTKKIKRAVYYKNITVSTNNDAMTADAPDGSVFLAEFQTGGKGSRGRSWLSDSGDGILMSILLFSDLAPQDISKITLVAGLAVCKVLGQKGFEALIKWPNDTVISGKKVCGILTEKKKDRIAVGIGINVNAESFDGDLKEKATSLYIESGKTFEREEFVDLIAAEFEKVYTILHDNGFSALREEYKENCVTIGKKIKVELPCSSYEAEAVDVNGDGELVILHNGNFETVRSGEVSVRGIYGYV